MNLKILSVVYSALLLNTGACLLPNASRCANALADLVFINSTLYQLNDRQPTAQAIAIKGDRIVMLATVGCASSLGKSTPD